MKLPLLLRILCAVPAPIWKSVDAALLRRRTASFGMSFARLIGLEMSMLQISCGDATNPAKNERTNDTAYPCCPDVVGAAICIVRIEFPARAAQLSAAGGLATHRPLQNPPIARGSIRFNTSSRRMKE